MSRSVRWVVLVFAGAVLWASGAGAAEFRVPLMEGPPVLDGRIEPAEWARSAGVSGFAMKGRLERRRVRAWVGAVGGRLFAAIQSQLPVEGELLTTVEKDTVKVVFDDSVEVWLDPTPGSEHGRVYQMLANAAGRQGYKMHARGRERAEPSWRGRWAVANGMHDGWWHCEVAIPIEDIAPGRAATEGVWGINLCRNWKRPWGFSSLAGGPYAPEGIRFTFARETALAVHHTMTGDPASGDLDMTLAVTNGASEPMPVEAAMVVERDQMPTLRSEDSLRLLPGKSRTLRLEGKDVSTQKFQLRIRVASADGKTVHYDRSLAWKAAKPWRWTVEEKKVLPIDLQFAYYPYRNRLRLLADVRNLPAKAKLERLRCVVRKKGEDQPVKAVVLDQFENGRQAVSVELSPLEGSYEIAARAEGADVPEGEFVEAFERTRFQGGRLGAQATCTWDYDGVMRVDLTLTPDAPQKLDALRLEIPLQDAAAPMIHAMADGIRNTIYARVPEGEGVVWDASKVQVNDFPRNFCSYIYVGGPKRGLCWFAENDAGWSWDRERPNLDLARKGGQLILRVHLVNKPVVIAEPRTMTFGLLAAPVKPRIGNWRYAWHRENYTLLGTDINWLARGNCGSVYPAGKDMYLWEMLKRGNREKLSREEVQKVIERGRTYFEPYGEDYVERFERHVPHNLLSRHGKKMVFYYNRASCQLFPEFQTFQDEWCLTDYRTVGPGDGIGEIKIVPTASYIDHALYWYGKSFEIGGNQGVYWDNMYLRASYNRAMTSAYERPDGSIMPSTGIWGLRELVKRTFVYMNERGMRPITMPHMTSTGILPVYSFATVQYDWEWKYSRGDVQYRFPREYILLVSTGELAGTWPVLLGDHGKLARDEWTQRTFAGVCLVHELDGWGAGTAWKSLFGHVHRPVETPGLEVYRYWDDRPQPVTSGEPDLPVIVYALPGKEAYVGVTSYAEEAMDVTLRIDPKPLGLGDGYRAVDAETDEPVPVAENEVAFRLKKHDVRAVRLLAK